MQVQMLVVVKHMGMAMWLQTIVKQTTNVHLLLQRSQPWCAVNAQ